ncbi:DNA-binding response regulator [Marinilabiliaceae bacterium JC017]|nr:DNA-binding response regulator [Marinilabiliaceae bacterium JC017]
MSPDKVLIVEDSILTAEVIKGYLTDNGFTVCGIAKSFMEANACFEEHNPSLLICDIHLEGKKNGIEFVTTIRENHPATLIIFISSDMQLNVLSKAQQTKPHAYLTKPFTEEQLITTIQMAVIRNNQDNPAKFDLTDKDLEVLNMLGQGLSNKQIGEQLFISPHTVDSRRRKILLKLNVTSINQALCIASEKGWLHINPVEG